MYFDSLKLSLDAAYFYQHCEKQRVKTFQEIIFEILQSHPKTMSEYITPSVYFQWLFRQHNFSRTWRHPVQHLHKRWMMSIVKRNITVIKLPKKLPQWWKHVLFTNAQADVFMSLFELKSNSNHLWSSSKSIPSGQIRRRKRRCTWI